jgi:hypothetical protein
MISLTLLCFAGCACSGETILAGDARTDRPCDEATISMIPVAPEVLILLDRSNSMYYDNFWDATRSAVAGIVRTYEADVMFGLALFPGPLATPDNDAFDCTVASYPDVPIDFFTGGSIDSFLASVVTVGGTPVAETLTNMEGYLLGRPYDNPRTILLATDGAPNCNASLDGNTCRCTCNDPSECGLCPDLNSNCLDDARTYEALDRLREDGFPTWVIGLSQAAVEWGDVMQAMARHGGTESFYAAEDPGQVRQIFEEIMSMVARCAYHLSPSETPDPGLVNFYIDGTVVPIDPESRTGWNWSGESTIQFFGPTCDRIVSGGAETLEATYGCPTVTR